MKGKKMGLFEKIFTKKNPRVQFDQTFKLLNGYQPTFNPWGGNAYESELVRACIDAKARHIGKFKVEVKGSAKPALQTKLKHAPNGFQTWYQFLYRVSTILDMQNTAFIVPVLGEYGEITGIYPIYTNEYSLKQYKDKPYLCFKFDNGNSGSMELENVGILTKFQYKNDFFGETNKALTPAMELIDIQNQGIKEGVKSSASFRFMATMGNFASDEDLERERKRFTETNLRRGSGMLLFPNTYKDVKQIISRPYVADAATMRATETKMFDYFGVNEDVLQNKAYGDSWSAFYEGALEPFAIQLSEVVTKMLFTQRERSEGNQVMATANRLQYMTTRDKLNVSTQLSDRGVLNRDEVREIWNLPPLPNGEGQAYIIRGEYWNANEKINGESEDQGDGEPKENLG